MNTEQPPTGPAADDEAFQGREQDVPLTVEEVPRVSGYVKEALERWAGRGYDPAGPVRREERTTWFCTECERAGTYKDPVPPERMATQHAGEHHHVAQAVTTVTFIPGEPA